VSTERERLKSLYDDMRTALLNRKYYGCRLVVVKRRVLRLDVVVAIGSSSTVAGWAIWKGEIGSWWWGLIAGLAAVVAVVRPILQLGSEVERCSRLFTNFGDVYFDLKRIAEDSRGAGRFGENEVLRYTRSVERMKALSTDDDPDPDRALLTRLYVEVDKEHPASTLWMPAGND
jgi:hypothetical protein